MFPELGGSHAEMLHGVTGGGRGVENAVKLSPV
jgi:hypothetical protein